MKKLTKDLSDFKKFELKNVFSIRGGGVLMLDDNGGPIDPVKRPTGGSTTTTGSDRP